MHPHGRGPTDGGIPPALDTRWNIFYGRTGNTGK